MVNDPISPETQYADVRHEPDPARSTERDRLGLLGRLASVRCLIEVYSEPPNGTSFRACLSKHLAFWQQNVRDQRSRRSARSNHRSLARPDAGPPFLWILSAGRPAGLLAELKPQAPSSWPAGVYLVGGDVLRVGIVDASELPRDSSTMLIRLMVGGELLTPLVAEVTSLGVGTYLRTVAEPILLELADRFNKASTRTPAQEKFVTAVIKSWEDGKAEARTQGRKEGWAEGRREGREEGRKEAGSQHLLSILRIRSISVPDAARERILAESDPAQLNRWIERAVVATSIEEILDVRRDPPAAPRRPGRRPAVR